MTRVLSLTLLLASAAAAPVSAATLQEALAQAYRSNPTLTGARAQQRANDENVPIQRARGLPTLDTSGGFSEFLQTNRSGSGGTGTGGAAVTGPNRQLNAGVTAAVPLYLGGAVRNAVRAADARVEAGRENLRDTESAVFTQVVAAYSDVIRDESIVSLNRANVRVLEVNLAATRDRFQVGDVTRTDVAQSEARLSLARGQLQAAEAQLINSREQYIRFVGVPSGSLEPPPALPNLPADAQSAVGAAVDQNPALRAALRNREASRFNVGVARASRLPRVSATIGGNYVDSLGSIRSNVPGVSFDQSSFNSTAGVAVSLPLFQGGGPAAQVRQAQALESQSIEQVTEVERAIVAQARAAFASYQASNAQVVSNQAAVQANTLALEGVRAENSVGNRTILDVLNAEQELLNAQVNLVSARRNAYVAGFSLLATIGRAEARDLGLEGGALYDPTVNYRRVRNSIWDFDDDPRPVPQATRTVDTPAQNAVVTSPAATGTPRR